MVARLLRLRGRRNRSGTGSPGQAKPSADDEKAIRATADDFVKAFNAGDAKTIGAEWSTDSEYTDENGQEFHGRAAIEKEYAAPVQGASRRDHNASHIASIRFLGPDIAIEKGVASVKFPKGEQPTAARYSVVHARRDGKWVMVVGRDMPYVAGNGDYFKDLEWMIGEWKADGIRSGLQIKSEWLAGRNFIKNTYTTTADGKTTLTGADHRLGSAARADRRLALRRRRGLWQRCLDEGRQQVGARGLGNSSRRQ